MTNVGVPALAGGVTDWSTLCPASSTHPTCPCVVIPRASSFVIRHSPVLRHSSLDILLGHFSPLRGTLPHGLKFAAA